MRAASISRTPARRRPKTSQDERVCPICSQAFSKAEHLARHYRSHTKEKPFQCSVCQRVYARQDTLLRHIRTSCSRKHPREESFRGSSTTAHDDTQDPTIDHSLLSTMRSKSSSHLSTGSATGAACASMPLGHPVLEPHRSPNKNVAEGSVSDTFAPVDGNYSDSSLLEAIVTAPNSLQDNVNGAIQEPVDVPQRFDLSGNDMESGWTSWLLCDDFNLEAVNHSLLQATGERNSITYSAGLTEQSNIQPPRMISRSVDAGFPENDDAIKQKWHTYCEPTFFGRVSPDSTLKDNGIDETYRQELNERLQPRIQTGILPSTTFIHLCLRAYFTYFQPIFPIVHEPSFYPSKRNTILLLSMCSIGSLFLGSPRAMEHGISMFERLQNANVSSWEVLIAIHPDSRTAAMQAALLGQSFGFLLGRPKDLAGIDFFHGAITAWARRGNLRRVDEYPCDPTGLVGDALEAAWKNWAATEVKKRVALGVSMQDAELTKLHLHDSVLRHCCERLPTTSSDKPFAAPTATAWKSLMVQDRDPPRAQLQELHDNSEPSNTIQIPKRVSNFEQCSLLESISVVAYESHQPNLFGLNMTSKCQELLIEWYNSFQTSSDAETIWTLPLMILWHASFIMLYANIDLLERACGRDGSDIGHKTIKYVQEWAHSGEAKRCLLHAIYVQRAFELMTIGNAFPIHIPLCLYHCGIIWFCFGKFGSDSKVSTKDFDNQFQFPEFQLLATSGRWSLQEGFGNFQKHWDHTDQVFNCIDLLRRVPHWKLPRNLASTLLAIIEEKDIF